MAEENPKKIHLSVINNSPLLEFDPFLNESAIICTKEITEIGKIKEYFSYSEISTWMECNYRHYLKYIAAINLDSANEYTEYGKTMHDAMQVYLKDRVFPPFDKIRETVRKVLTELKSEKKLDIEGYVEAVEPTLTRAAQWLDIEFPGWEFVSAEEELLESTGHDKAFKGFIDAVIKIPSKVAGEFIYWILDWKTCEVFWHLQKQQDPKKQLQLILYKHFWSKKHNIDLKDIRCGFVLLRRKVNKENKERCMLVTVSVGPKTLEKGIDTIDNFIFHIKKEYRTKNRASCKYCVYKDTEHCTF